MISRINKYGFKAHPVFNWLINRISGPDITVNKLNFVSGCKLYKYKVLRRMEIMVDGNVVLCCDDAYANETYGNIFKSSIENLEFHY